MNIRNLGWNLGKAFGIKRIQTLTLIKMSLPTLFAIWRFQLLSVKCLIPNQNVELNYTKNYMINIDLYSKPLHSVVY